MFASDTRSVGSATLRLKAIEASVCGPVGAASSDGLLLGRRGHRLGGAEAGFQRLGQPQVEVQPVRRPDPLLVHLLERAARRAAYDLAGQGADRPARDSRTPCPGARTAAGPRAVRRAAGRRPAPRSLKPVSVPDHARPVRQQIAQGQLRPCPRPRTPASSTSLCGPAPACRPGRGEPRPGRRHPWWTRTRRRGRPRRPSPPTGRRPSGRARRRTAAPRSRARSPPTNAANSSRTASKPSATVPWISCVIRSP